MRTLDSIMQPIIVFKPALRAACNASKAALMPPTFTCDAPVSDQIDGSWFSRGVRNRNETREATGCFAGGACETGGVQANERAAAGAGGAPKKPGLSPKARA